MNSPHWGTHCPEYKVTAVQVTPVEQPWQRQREYRDLNQIQEGL
jgi:formate dehydrogenase major subunit